MFIALRERERYALAELCFCTVAFIIPAIVLGIKLYGQGNFPALFHSISLAVVLSYMALIADCINDEDYPGTRHRFYAAAAIYLITLVLCVYTGITQSDSRINLWLPLVQLVYAYCVTHFIFWPLFRRTQAAISKHLPA